MVIAPGLISSLLNVVSSQDMPFRQHRAGDNFDVHLTILHYMRYGFGGRLMQVQHHFLHYSLLTQSVQEKRSDTAV